MISYFMIHKGHIWDSIFMTQFDLAYSIATENHGILTAAKARRNGLPYGSKPAARSTFCISAASTSRGWRPLFAASAAATPAP